MDEVFGSAVEVEVVREGDGVGEDEDEDEDEEVAEVVAWGRTDDEEAEIC